MCITHSNHHVSFKIEADGAGELDVFVGLACGGEGDFEVAAAGFDALVSSDEGAGGDACAAGEGLVLDAALRGADGKGTVGKVFDEVDVDAEGPAVSEVAEAASLPYHVVMFQVLDTHDEVRSAAECGVEPIMLDNMDDATMKQAVEMIPAMRPMSSAPQGPTWSRGAPMATGPQSIA